MIELPTVTRSNGFSYNNETHRNRENSEADFSELAKNAGLIDKKSQHAHIAANGMGNEILEVSNIEITTYTFLGKKTIFGKYTGGTIDFEI